MNIKRLYRTGFLAVLLLSLSGMANAQMNTLTAKEKKEGWKLLFDGKTGHGWRGASMASFPTAAHGWIVKDGTMTIQASNGAESQNVGDIVTVDEYSA